MGITDFFKKDKGDDSSSKSIPTPPKKPGDGQASTPPDMPSPNESPDKDASNDTGVPKPPQGDMPEPPQGKGQKEQPAPSPQSVPEPGRGAGRDLPPVPESPKEKGSKMPPAPKAKGNEAAMREEAESMISTEKPSGSMPSAPAAPKKSSEGMPEAPAAPEGKQDNMGDVPSAPKQSETMSMPEGPDDLELPEFDDEELDQMEKQKDMDWTEGPDNQEEKQEAKPAKQEVKAEPEELGPEQTTAPEVHKGPEGPEEPEAHEEPEEKEESPQVTKEPEGEISTDTSVVHTSKGDLYVRAEHYQDLFSSIKDMKGGLGGLMDSVQKFADTTNAQDETYDTIINTLNEVQDIVMDTDRKLFEER